MKKIFFLFIVMILNLLSQAQPLQVTHEDPLFSTYAAPVSRSSYKNDQGYRMNWNDPESGVEFISKQGPSIGIAFEKDGILKLPLGQMYREPVVTLSYSDLVKYFYYPFPEFRVEVFFDVYSSRSAFMDITILNESKFTQNLSLLPYLYFPSADPANDLTPREGTFQFQLFKNRDAWMKEHGIPAEEKLQGSFISNWIFDSIVTFVNVKQEKSKLVSAILASDENSKRAAPFVKGVAGCRSIRVAPGERTSLRMVIDLRKEDEKINHPLIKKIMDIDEESLIRDDEKIFQNIPALKGISRDQQIFYQSCFSLMRQCMMPPEGECKTNYYVFSREPRWGWGYGGQVFHESLAMLAYVFMDPKGAMDSQRIYMQRQHDNGYINYRTGPYLNESIPCDSTFTSSAPWYNYENYEIYKITKDRAFLKEAYESGKKFYEFYVASRDSNSNGLCEWGGEASLESVRDARVAVWDQVGWPSNFEGPDVNSMLVMEAKSLEKMAKELGLEQESKKWKKDWEQRADKINWFMWDESTGLYYNINRNNQSFTFRKDNDLKIKEIIGFLPYWAGIPDSAQVERLMQVMKDSAEFWRPNGISTLSAKESYYNPIGYWNGPVWVQWNYLLFRGMLDHGDTTGAKILASRVINTMIWHLKNDHTFWEFYSPDDHQAGWNQTYIWAGIAARFLIDLHDNQ